MEGMIVETESGESTENVESKRMFIEDGSNVDAASLVFDISLFLFLFDIFTVFWFFLRAGLYASWGRSASHYRPAPVSVLARLLFSLLAASDLVAVGDLISSDNRATAQDFGFTSRRRFMRKGREFFFHQVWLVLVVVGYSPVRLARYEALLKIRGGKPFR